MAREDPSPLFTDKLNEKYFSERIKEKFNIFRGERGLDVESTNYECVRFATQFLACKLLRKCRRAQVLVGVIASTEKCIEGI